MSPRAWAFLGIAVLCEVVVVVAVLALMAKIF